MSTLTYTFIDPDTDEETTATFPAKYEVCWDCQGEGRTMVRGMRYHAYTWDEMDENGPDFAEDYFGGKYDETCRTCKGQRVNLVADEEAVLNKRDPQQIVTYHKWKRAQEIKEIEDYHDARTRWAESGYDGNWQEYLD